ncbi:Homeobox protein tos8 [Stygiomarasmius scandens]|uniref:Homeobox protein tos8 n=1 Tax=Marasmiellus scandens TaxID=2682957 RepID=A0ABR1ILJ2_9AGAR
MRCRKRSLKCEYPTESRRGMRKKKTQKTLKHLSAEAPDNQSERSSDTMGSSTSVPWQIPGSSHLPGTANSVGFDSPIARELPKNIDYLEAWLLNHSGHLTEEEIQKFCYDTGLSTSQVSDWMMNASYFVPGPYQYADDNQFALSLSG